MIDCELGRKMEITMVEVVNEVKHINEQQKKQGENIQKILDKFDNLIPTLDEKYASKFEVKQNESKINALIKYGLTAAGTVITSMFAIIMFLLK